MKIETIICDCCGEEIPKVKKKDIFGIEREYYRLGKLNYAIHLMILTAVLSDFICVSVALGILVWKCTKQE